MKKMLLLSTVMLSLISAQSFAWDIYKGKLVSHKEWTNGDVKLTFKKSLGANDLASKHRDDTGSIGLYTYVNISNVTGTVDQTDSINSSNFTQVRNYTDATQMYRYSYTICSMVSDNKDLCAFYSDILQIEAGGYANNNTNPTLEVKFAKPGTYATYTGVTLQTNPFTYDGNQTSSNASGTIEVK